jgi:hypothetical protein
MPVITGIQQAMAFDGLPVFAGMTMTTDAEQSPFWIRSGSAGLAPVASLRESSTCVLDSRAGQEELT